MNLSASECFGYEIEGSSKKLFDLNKCHRPSQTAWNMSDRIDQTSTSRDEINLLDLMLILWKKRITLLISAAVSAVVGVLLALDYTPTYKGQVQLHPLNEVEMAGFNAWNQGVKISNRQAPTLASDILLGESHAGVELSSITSKSLADAFIANYERGDSLVAALRMHSTAVQNFNGDEAELSLMLSEMAKNFALEEGDNSANVKIVFTTSNKAESFQILSSALDLVFSKTKADKLRSIQSKLEATELSRRLELDRIRKKFEGYMRLYEARKERSLTLLREQAEIARELGIETPDRQTQGQEMPAPSLGLFESNYFLQGYRAIDKQISNIEQREDNQNPNLVDEIDQLVLDRAIMQARNILEMMTPLKEKLPLHDPDFRLVRVDLSSTTFESDGKRRLIAILVTLVGMLIAVVFVLASNAMKRRIAG